MSVMRSRGLIDIAATPSEVFETICEFADPPPMSRVVMPLGLLGSGAVYEVRSRALGRRFTHVLAIRQWMPPTSIEFHSIGRPQFACSVAYMLSHVESATRVDLTLTVTPRGPWRLTRPLVGRLLDPITRDSLKRLRHCAEARHASHLPNARG